MTSTRSPSTRNDTEQVPQRILNLLKNGLVYKLIRPKMKNIVQETTIQCGEFKVEVKAIETKSGEFEVIIKTDNGDIVIHKQQSHTRNRYDRNKNRKAT